MKQITFTLLICTLFAVVLTAQPGAPHFFQPAAESALPARTAAPGQVFPQKHTTWSLDQAGLENALATAPWEFTADARAHTCVIAVPNAAGEMEDFAVWQTAMIDPTLAARHPYLHTYAGESLHAPGTIIRLSITARGFRAMILRPGGGVEYVHPWAPGQSHYYLAYDQDDVPVSPLMQLEREAIPALPAALEPYAPPAETRGTLLEPVQLQIYRFAASTTGEFGVDHGGTVPLVLSAVVEYTNDMSVVYERDLDLRLQLVGNNDEIIFVDPATDPYTGVTVQDWLAQNAVIVNTIIGFNNFDLGHVYARYITGGAIGVGQIAVACNSDKARGCTAGNGINDYGPGFLTVLGQEIGHQLGGGHTWNRCGGGGGRQGSTAFEPGSGSTIMSYAGACGSDNVQGYSDLYFHAGSIEEIGNYLRNGWGNQCGTLITTDNNPPQVTLPYQDNFFIPVGTPFELNGSATDADGDALTYCWEEMDTGPEVPLENPEGGSPLFRTRPAVGATNRYFPRLLTVITNGFDLTEQLPTYSRELNFRLTARDNRPGGGGVGWADVSFKVTDEAGPFRVTEPNTAGFIWKSGEYAQVVWDVANTQLSPVNCQTVNILLSTNGGQAWPTVLASGTGNDGSQYVLVPNIPTVGARVRVQAADNVFYDISNANFRIEQPTQPSLTLGLSTDAAQVCLPNPFITEILTAGVLGFANPVTLEVSDGLPPGATASFSASVIDPGQNSTLTLDMSDVTAEGVFTVTLRAWADGTDTLLRTLTLTLVRNDFSAQALQLPADGSVGLSQLQTLRWQPSPDANAYDVQLADNPSFEPLSIVASASDVTVDTFKVPIQLEKGKAYYWRVRPTNECGLHNWTEPFFFATLGEDCALWSAGDLPITISANGAPTVESKINVGIDATISDVNVKQVKGYHNEFGQLEVTLIDPAGTQVILFKNKCGVIAVPFDVGFDDNAANNFLCPPPNAGGNVKPQNPLSAFNGHNSAGQWTLRVKDQMSGAGGTLQEFKIELCASVALNPPYLINNNPLSIETGVNKVITSDLLLVGDPNNTHDELVFTLVTTPNFGRLEKNWGGEMQPGDQFTQTDLDNGAIRYFDYGGALDEEYFRFTVSDGEGGFLGTPKFVIQPFSVGTNAPANPALDFALFPNPASETAWVALGRPAGSNARISLFDAAGRLAYTTVLPAGADRVSLPLNALSPGFYAVRMENEAGVGVKKLIVE